MFEIITLEKFEYWDMVVQSFCQHDVYYLCGYAKGFNIHGDGEPLLLYYHDNNIRGICVMMKRDISQVVFFENRFTKNTLFDMISPYGYGGFIFEGEMNPSSIQRFNKAYCDRMKEENIVSAFVRYHPQLHNANNFRTISQVIDLGETIDMDLESKELIWQNIIGKNRTAIRKSIKNGVVIKHGKDIALFNEFIKIYNETMDHDHAEKYYYFEKEYYESIHFDLYNNYEIFYAEYDRKIIAMSIILFANKRMHYHLSGSVYEYRHLAPTNQLLYEVACWGNECGFKSFHLGGGIASNKDNLFKFKQTFNKKSNNNHFSIGKQIFIPEKYKELVQIRIDEDNEFNKESDFFPLYYA